MSESDKYNPVGLGIETWDDFARRQVTDSPYKRPIDTYLADELNRKEMEKHHNQYTEETNEEFFHRCNLQNSQTAKIAYKYNEDKALQEIAAYIDKTYGEHYSQNKYQATEFIIDGGHGTGFCIGNVLKYAQRYGNKGTTEDWRKDLMKVIHYTIIQLHVHDLNYNKEV